MKLVEINGDGTLSAKTGPLPEATRSVIESTVGLYARVGWRKPWIGYLAFENHECVGTCAFTSAPKDGVVEIAYCTLSGHEGRGVATRMAQCLVALARITAPEVSVTAHTLPQENASTRILRKLGFVLMGPTLHAEDGLIWVWRREEERDAAHRPSPEPPSASIAPAAAQPPRQT
jgi:RimJ/RimL family protein N-acetyltransferase